MAVDPGLWLRLARAKLPVTHTLIVNVQSYSTFAYQQYLNAGLGEGPGKPVGVDPESTVPNNKTIHRKFYDSSHF